MILEIVTELVRTGRAEMLEQLREDVPAGLIEMQGIPGLGAAKIRQIHETLGIETLADLEAAARDGRLAALPRFGQRTAQNILKGIAFLRQASQWRLSHHAAHEARAVQEALARLPHVARGVRRRRSAAPDGDRPRTGHRARGRRAAGRSLPPSRVAAGEQRDRRRRRAARHAAPGRRRRGAGDRDAAAEPRRGAGAGHRQRSASCRARTASGGARVRPLRRGALGRQPLRPHADRGGALRNARTAVDPARAARNAARSSTCPCRACWSTEDLRGFLHCHTTASDGTQHGRRNRRGVPRRGVLVRRHHRSFARRGLCRRPWRRCGAEPVGRDRPRSTANSPDSGCSRGSRATSWSTARSIIRTKCWRASIS